MTHKYAQMRREQGVSAELTARSPLPGLNQSVASAMSVIDGLPMFWPALVFALALAALLAVPVAHLLRARVWVALFLLGSLALITASTLSPSVPAYFVLGARTECVSDGFSPPGLADLVAFNQTGLNVLLFVPLGLACALLPRWPQVALLSALASAVPFGVELIQLAVPRLGRVCSTADAAANLTGLFAGLLGGLLLVRPILMVAAPADQGGGHARG
jgi:hypothetical protein